MKRTHALIAVLALMSMTTVAQVAHAQAREQGASLERVASLQAISPVQWRQDQASAITPIVGDKAESKQTRKMALGKG